ncbi:secretion protein HlyD [Rhizobium mesosinicum]|uniref:Secretion protein HlyD n=1 Tax=Rhizobium mesosinicum TaxID=335017 RepID=A0ABS7H2M6_9HYPH|nr:secretion protein HlyD [Rhizobium mesosinicum]MBW9056528.1 secretion protein HlyD [Rhizobium mesosinicum]
MRRIIPLAILILVAAGAAAWWYGLPQKFGWLPERTRQFALYGNVDIRQVSLGFRVNGRLASLAVDEGDMIKSGDVLGKLDTAPFEAAVTSAEANVAALQATLDKLKAGPRPTEIAQAEAAHDESLAALRNANIAYDRARQLRPQGTISEASLDQATANRSMAAARADSTEQALKLLQEGSRVEDIANAEAQLKAAQSSLTSARISLADAELRAPDNGVILSRVREPGAIVSPADTVYVLSLTQPVWVRSYVAEGDLGRLHPGMKVQVTSDTQPDKPYDGTVGFISPVAEFTPKSVETPQLRTDLVYRLRIVIDKPGPDLRQGMPVTVHFPSLVAQ